MGLATKLAEPVRAIPGVAAISEWRTTPAERERRFPCDDLIEDPDLVLWRAVDVAAPPAIVYRWLCQLRYAPYSYDWLDNLGRRSPRHLIKGACALEAGQRFMTIFRLETFESSRSITVTTRGWAFGQVAITYEVVPYDAGSRLIAKVVVRAPRGPYGWLLRGWLPAGDLVMMRKQLLTLKALAEDHTVTYDRSPWPAGRTSLLPPPDWSG